MGAFSGLLKFRSEAEVEKGWLRLQTGLWVGLGRFGT